jgi:hypothetical protein
MDAGRDADQLHPAAQRSSVSGEVHVHAAVGSRPTRVLEQVVDDHHLGVRQRPVRAVPAAYDLKDTSFKVEKFDVGSESTTASTAEARSVGAVPGAPSR